MKGRSFFSVAGLIATLLLSLAAAIVADGQEKSKYDYKFNDSGFCKSDWSFDGKPSSRELREFRISAGPLTVDAGRNGGVAVRSEDRQDVLVRACIVASGETEQSAKTLAGSIRVETGGSVRAEGPADGNGWSVSYQIAVPRNTDLKLTATNGGIAIAGVSGNIEFETKNGGVSLVNLAGNVRGSTLNGGVSVRLGGDRWEGSGLDVETKNGGIVLSMSDGYAARVETGTVNGGYRSDFAALKIQSTEKYAEAGRKRVTADINGGGAPIRVVTTNGGVVIKAEK